MRSCEFFKNLKDTFFHKTSPVTDFGISYYANTISLFVCRHVMSFQRRYDVVRCRKRSYRRWNEVVCQQDDFFSAALYLCFLKLFLCNKHTRRINPLGNFYLICICTVQSNIFFYFICDSSDRTSVIAPVYISYSYDTFLIMFSSYSKTLYVELRHCNRLIMFPRLWKSKNWFCCDLS